MAEIVPSLFGIDPNTLQQQRLAQAQEQARLFAQMSPNEQVSYGGYMAGSQFGNTLGGLMGAKDPELQRITDIRTASEGEDTTTAEGLANVAKKLAAMGRNDEALRIMDKVNSLTATKAAVAKVQAETTNQLTQAEENRAKAAETYRTILTAKEKKENRIKALKELGIPENQIEGIASDDKTFESYLKRAGTTITEADGLVLMVDDRTGKIIKTLGKAPERGTRVNVDASTKQEGAFAVERGKLQAKSLSEWEAARDASSAVVPKIDSMIASNNAGQLYTGPQAPVTKTFANLLNSANLLSPKAQEQLTKSEVYDKYAKDLVFAEMEGKLGTGVSNADREYIEARVPQLSTSPKARSELLSKFKELHQKRIDKANAAVKHANKYGNLNEFNLESSPKPSVIKLD